MPTILFVMGWRFFSMQTSATNPFTSIVEKQRRNVSIGWTYSGLTPSEQSSQSRFRKRSESAQRLWIGATPLRAQSDFAATRMIAYSGFN